MNQVPPRLHLPELHLSEGTPLVQTDKDCSLIAQLKYKLLIIELAIVFGNLAIESGGLSKSDLLQAQKNNQELQRALHETKKKLTLITG